ncbi:uncharacterized protein AMSG_02577 [Thecamonas trahens ATCC 50062]|uniref:Glycogen debranching enzyme n=1 Tax=Thecamonas trahens ATCC 50062 TaxID=461836 RepID=A0A0L0D597_THETB|nr:hypothetical protein AMSG_02577 [Thecamonas trahens ATCC 50062]KNC47552.1 hypothetical protein AMSG_02577 [Thecamonas trahens ATCC 50062]|eukprot:XP_013759484.1 hypothetical protein AMSG_02577 [Thecamonas trahens ATCC 50062]
MQTTLVVPTPAPASLAPAATPRTAPWLATELPSTPLTFDASARAYVADVTVSSPGVHRYKVVMPRAKTGSCPVSAEHALVVVLPASPPRAIATVLAKCMGPLDRWEEVLAPAQTGGYSTIHFTPVQALGDSGSAYAIADQLSPAPAIGSWDALAAAADSLRARLGLELVVDVVWNHTAASSQWIRDNPDVCYSLANSPHLIPAFVLDDAIARFSSTCPPSLATPASDADVDAVLDAFRSSTFAELRLWEYFVIDVDGIVAEAHAFWAMHPYAAVAPALAHLSVDERVAHICASPSGITRIPGARFPLRPHLPLLLTAFGDEASLRAACDLINLPHYREYDEHVAAAFAALRGTLAWERLGNGPRAGVSISADAPLAPSYFTRLVDDASAEATPQYIVANNGWVGADPTVDFAGPASFDYLRRAVNIWGDLVKLRYGSGPADSPAAWKQMVAYTETMASIFDGFRIDNAHSTPMHVAEALLDAARAIRPNLYVMAELFTPSAERDAEYVAHLGIHNLIREGLHVTSPRALADFLYTYSGARLPVAALSRELAGVPPHVPRHKPGAIVYEATHDNPAVAELFPIEHALGLAALIGLTASDTGSNWGYDWLVPHHLNVVTEARLYPVPNSGAFIFTPLKAAIHDLAAVAAAGAYSEFHVEACGDVIVLTRANAESQDGIVVVVRCALAPARSTESITLPGPITRLAFAASLELDEAVASSFTQDDDYINGLSGAKLTLWRDHAFVYTSGTWEPPLPQQGLFGYDRASSELDLRLLPVGGVLAFTTSAWAPGSAAALGAAWLAEHVDGDEHPSLTRAVEECNGLAINVALYRCEAEEQNAVGRGVYHVPGAGPLVYAGLQGFDDPLRAAAVASDMGAPVCANLRAGGWALQYSLDRLDVYLSKFGEVLHGLAAFREWLGKAVGHVLALPAVFVPRYFFAVVRAAVDALTARALALCPNLPPSASTLTQRLAMTSFQVFGPTAEVPTGSLAAGLPHFSAGFMREWGRDTFIALRGLFLVTGRVADAEKLLINFARTPRYNARDASWWFLHALVDYDALGGDGARAFLTNPHAVVLDAPWDESRPVVSLVDVAAHILEAHLAGIQFRETNAGGELDAHMSDAGFNVSAGVAPATGFVHGGSAANCGTWMDKMGSSSRAGNAGVPATPRDGSAIELVALCAAVLRWLAKTGLVASLALPSDEAAAAWGLSSCALTPAAWYERIASNFEPAFYIPLKPAAGDGPGCWAVTTGVYKDCVGASHGWTDWQLRPNCAVALAVAPELFDADHAKACLRTLTDTLVGTLGMRTLDPRDPHYAPVYDNSTDSDAYATAAGFNYHQGPEWVWPLGYLLRALAVFFGSELDVGASIDSILHPHAEHLETDVWHGMPELVNPDGAECPFSCPTQAWSSATLLDALHVRGL